MIVNISTTYRPATDLGYLLHKHPDTFAKLELSAGNAYIFYPEKNEKKTTVSLLLDIDPIGMIRRSKKRTKNEFTLGHYVNDRPYVTSSLMSVALSKAFSSAMNGKCKERPNLIDIKFPFEVSLSSIPAPNGGEALIKSFFEPLGYRVEVISQRLDDMFPKWGESKYYSLKLKNTVTTKELLSHLYVLISALNNDKHYFVNQSEIEKLLQKGKGWLDSNPAKEQITKRYLLNLQTLSQQALERLTQEEEEMPLQKRKDTLHEKRIQLVAQKLIDSGAKSILDLGCGEGKLIRLLMQEKQFSKIAGMDVSYEQLLKAKNKLHYDEMAPKQKERIYLFQGSLMYKDKRLEGFDAAAVVEVIEHLDFNRLKTFERVLFEFAKPKTIVLTTPNKEYNVLFENMNVDEMRHDDHRFEWTQQDFSDWAHKTAKKYHYSVEILSIGDEVKNFGAPSQMALFTYGN